MDSRLRWPLACSAGLIVPTFAVVLMLEDAPDWVATVFSLDAALVLVAGNAGADRGGPCAASINHCPQQNLGNACNNVQMAEGPMSYRSLCHKLIERIFTMLP
ncbi:MAG: hypothetical protein ACR2OU_16095 [Thermomicrobiales bacterium]